MSRPTTRIPRNYQGTQTTSHQISDLLPNVLRRVSVSQQERPDLILAAWPELVGAQIASMTRAISFVDGILTVKVNNSTLYSLLNQHDKPRILARLKQQFPTLSIRNIIFRIG